MSGFPKKPIWVLAVALMMLSLGPAAWAAPRPVVLELFTSNGCSSCPPAHRLLSRLRADPPVENVNLILLSQHVDYWNNLGWEDRFSDARFTARQRRYARRVFGSSRVYTPQLVVDGRREMVGSRRAEVSSAIRAQADTATVPVSLAVARRGGESLDVRVNVGAQPRVDGAKVWVALTQDDVEARIGAGENSGRTLHEDGVVRSLVAAQRGKDAGRSPYHVLLDVPDDAALSNLAVVAFVQRVPMGGIVGATRRPLAGLARAAPVPPLKLAVVGR